MHERDLELPDLSDRADRERAPRHFPEDSKAGALDRGREVIEPQRRVDVLTAEPLRQCPDREQRADQRRGREITMPEPLPDPLRRRRDVGVIDLQEARRRDEIVEHDHR